MCDKPECYNEIIVRKARKVHLCCECRWPIEKGQAYQYVSGVWDRSPASFKTCLVCAEIRNEEYASLSDPRDCGPTFGGLDAWLREGGATLAERREEVMKVQKLRREAARQRPVRAL